MGGRHVSNNRRRNACGTFIHLVRDNAVAGGMHGSEFAQILACTGHASSGTFIHLVRDNAVAGGMHGSEFAQILACTGHASSAGA